MPRNPTAALPTMSITSDKVIDRHYRHDIRRLSGVKFDPYGKYNGTCVWYLVEGVAGKFLTLAEAQEAAAKNGGKK